MSLSQEEMGQVELALDTVGEMSAQIATQKAQISDLLDALRVAEKALLQALTFNQARAFDVVRIAIANAEHREH